MDRNKVIELLEEAERHIGDDHICCPRKVKKIIKYVRLLLRSEPVCETCGDEKEVWDTQEFGAREAGDLVPCPDCSQPKPEPSEFTKEIREYFADFIYAEEHGVPMQHEPRCLEHDLMQACDKIDALEAEVEKIKDEYKRYLKVSVEKWKYETLQKEYKDIKKQCERLNDTIEGLIHRQ